ncbi:MAG: N-acetyltransferase [Actinomycetota bacterium]|nr:N-acetyltransferase [Actinomycetota bacterium]
MIPAGPGDLDALSQVIAVAFHDLPPAQWLVADPAARAAIFPGFFKILLDWAMAAGTVTTTPGRDAAALWIPAGNHAPAPPEDYPGRIAAVAGSWLPQFEAFDAAMEDDHPAGAAHEWLAIIGVHPARQGLGLGSALLRDRHEALDRSGVGAYPA